MPIDPTIHFVTVKRGFKYGPDYVNILYDMVKRNLPALLDFKPNFVCLTDDPLGLDKGIETKPLPSNLDGSWNKLYLFKQRLFEEGSRVFYIDLDTAIVGDIREVASYRGEFAILRDFYRTQDLLSSVMLWRGGFGSQIWENFIQAGKPNIDGDDRVWIERFLGPYDILQDIFPETFVSFKESTALSVPKRARIVCFPGDPKPHQVKNGWVQDVWKIGGSIPNAASKEGVNPIENVKQALELPFPMVASSLAPHDRNISLIGGGASARDLVSELKRRKTEGEEIWALDGSYEWLSAAGIAPDAHILLDPAAACAKGVPKSTDAILLYASQCHPDVFARAQQASKRIMIWHPMIDGIRNVLGTRQAVFIGGGSTLGMYAITLAYTLGYRRIHLYGFDSSYQNEVGVPAKDAMNDNKRRIEVKIDDRLFMSSPHLAQQVNEFRLLIQRFANQGTTLTLHGDGLLPYVVRKMQKLGQQAK